MKHVQNNANNDAIFKRYNEITTSRKQQPFAKTFHKKYQGNGLPIGSPKKSTNQLNKSQNKSLLKSNQNSYRNIAILKEGATFNRNSSSKNKLQVIDSATRGARIYEQTKFQLSLSKLQEIINIFEGKIGNEACQIIQSLYNKNEQYLQLLYQWQKLQIYDEIDKKIYKLTQKYLHIIEVLIQKLTIKFNYRLQKYQQYLKQVEIESFSLLKQNHQLQQMLVHHDSFKLGQKCYLQQKMKEMYNKNQYSTFLLTEIQKNNFDLQKFANIVTNSTQQNNHTEILQSDYSQFDHSISLKYTKSQTNNNHEQKSTIKLYQKRGAINQKRSSN